MSKSFVKLVKSMVFQHIWALSRLDRLRGAVLLFWPTWAALLICTQGQVPIFEGVLFTLGVIFTRSFGCVINDISDVRFDRFVTRTGNRPLAAGLLNIKQAYGVFFLFLCLAFICWLYLAPQAKIAALVSLFLALLYPFTKRFFFALNWY
jgi:4-hydroxybenzoate polyprenyltransferase